MKMNLLLSLRLIVDKYMIFRNQRRGKSNHSKEKQLLNTKGIKVNFITVVNMITLHMIVENLEDDRPSKGGQKPFGWRDEVRSKNKNDNI